MHPYKVFKDSGIECDGMIFTSNVEFLKYIENTESAEEYLARQEKIERENHLLDLEEKYGIKFNL